MKKFLIVLSVIMIAAVIATCTIGCKKDPFIPDKLNVEEGSKPNFVNKILPDELTLINAGLESGATEAEIKTAVLALFDAADRIQREAELLFTISDGGGYAKTGAEGYMTVRGFYFRNGSGYYSQSAGEVTSANVGAVNAIGPARNMLDQLSRTYTADMQTFTREKAAKGSKAKKPDVTAYGDDFPYVKVDFSGCTKNEYNLEDWKVEARVLNQVGELSNFDFKADAIKDAEISYDDDEEFYTISFALDTGKKGTQAYDDVVNFARAGLREASTSDDLDYVVYNMTLEVWDNGYIRSVSSVENWEATLQISMFNIKGVSDSQNITFYYWDWDEIKEAIAVCDTYKDIESPEEFLAALKWF